MGDRSLVGVGATACALGLVFGAVALKTQRDHQRWCARGVRAQGVVVRLGQRRGTGLSEDASGTSTGPTFHTVSVVRFRGANGFEYEVDAPEAPREIGAIVTIAYDPREPSGGRAVERTPKIGCAVGLLVIGVVLIVIGMIREG